MSRRDFMTTAAMSAAGVVVHSNFAAGVCGNNSEIRSVLLHLGRNMWGDAHPGGMVVKAKGFRPQATELLLREELWREATNHASKRGMNMIVIDLGEALAYPSHPELAVKGAWSPDKMRQEILRLKSLGLEAIPKLNFSMSHNAWLKDYRCNASRLSRKQELSRCHDECRI